jgi:hypothetical protein
MNIYVVALLFAMGGISAYFANQRGRDPRIWFMVGALFGLLGLLLLFILPSLKKDTPEEVNAALQASQEFQAIQSIEKEYLSKEWFYLDQDEKHHGPLSFKALKDLWGKTEISASSLVWSEGMKEWQSVSNLPNFEELLK